MRKKKASIHIKQRLLYFPMICSKCHKHILPHQAQITPMETGVTNGKHHNNKRLGRQVGQEMVIQILKKGNLVHQKTKPLSYCHRR